MKALWRDYNLSVVLFILLLSSWVGQATFPWLQMPK